MAEETKLLDTLRYSLLVTPEQTKRMMNHFALAIPCTAGHIQQEVINRNIPTTNDHTDILQTWKQTDPSDITRHLQKDKRYTSKPVLSAFTNFVTSTETSKNIFTVDITGDPKTGTIQTMRLYKELTQEGESEASIECFFFTSEQQLLTFIQKVKQDPSIRSITRDITKKTLRIEEKQQESELYENLVYYDLGRVTIGKTEYLVFAEFEGGRKPPKGNSPIRDVQPQKISDPVPNI